MWSKTTRIFEGAQGASDTGESTPRKAGPEEFKTDSLTWQLESSFPLKPAKTKEEKNQRSYLRLAYHPAGIPRASSSNRDPAVRPNPRWVTRSCKSLCVHSLKSAWQAQLLTPPPPRPTQRVYAEHVPGVTLIKYVYKMIN